MKRAFSVVLCVLPALPLLGTLAALSLSLPACTRDKPTAPQSKGNLIAAVAQGDLGSVRELIRQGANPNEETGDGDQRLTPLLVSVALERNEITRELIRQGATSGTLHGGYSARDLAYYLEQDSLAATMQGN